jgi:predicted RNA binding protein with dsRBD fold (UPF0201 family)
MTERAAAEGEREAEKIYSIIRKQAAIHGRLSGCISSRETLGAEALRMPEMFWYRSVIRDILTKEL